MIVNHLKSTEKIIYQGLSNCRSLQYQWYFRPVAPTGESPILLMPLIINPGETLEQPHDKMRTALESSIWKENWRDE